MYDSKSITSWLSEPVENSLMVLMNEDNEICFFVESYYWALRLPNLLAWWDVHLRKETINYDSQLTTTLSEPSRFSKGLIKRDFGTQFIVEGCSSSPKLNNSVTWLDKHLEKVWVGSVLVICNGPGHAYEIKNRLQRYLQIAHQRNP